MPRPACVWGEEMNRHVAALSFITRRTERLEDFRGGIVPSVFGHEFDHLRKAGRPGTMAYEFYAVFVAKEFVIGPDAVAARRDIVVELSDEAQRDGGGDLRHHLSPISKRRRAGIRLLGMKQKGPAAPAAPEHRRGEILHRRDIRT